MLRWTGRHLRREDVAQAAGLGAVVVGIWMVFPPAAVVAGGIGLVLWAQGGGGDGNDA